jgi:hypothetical protein
VRVTSFVALVSITGAVSALMCVQYAEAQLLLADKNQRVAELFNRWCLESDLDFAAIDRRATQSGYEVQEDRSIPMSDGHVFRQKNWIIPLGQGESPVLLSSNGITNGTRRAQGCSIYGAELDGLAMEKELSKLARLGHPINIAKVPSGGETVWWTAHVGNLPPSEDTEVMLSRDIPHLPGVSVNLIYKSYSDRKDAAP